MAEYINKDKLIKAFYDEMQSMKNTDRSEAADKVFGILMRYVNSFEASDVQPVIHAEWILFDKDCCGRAFYCSNCRKVTTTDDFENTPLEREEYFCPRCGADMRNE